MIIWIQNNILEVLAVITGFICLYYEIIENYLTWVFSIISSILYVIFLFHNKLLAQMVFQIITIPISFYGLYMWLSGKYLKDKPKVIINNLSKNGWIYLIILTIIFTLISYKIELAYSDSEFVLADSFSAVLGVIALYLLAKKVIEQFFLWVFANMIPSIILFYQGFYLSSLLFMSFAILAVIGYLNWLWIQKQYAKKYSSANLSSSQA